MLSRLFPLLILSSALTACEQIALLATPKKAAIPSHSKLADNAETNFWETLHNGSYDKIPQAQKLLLAAYLQNPNDPKLAAHLGFLHIWKIAERHREKTNDPTIVDQMVLSKRFFSDAVGLNPADARFQGFLGDTMLGEGQIFKDEREQVRGYFQVKYAIHMWPEFNYFTGGYVMSSLPPDSKQFKEGLNWQWETLNLCSGTTIDHSNPDFSPYLSRETQSGPQRACWNSWIAPHNFEGFFLNMGDMLVKQGDWQTAVKIYNNARLSRTYASWPYRYLLEDRIKHAQENVENFRKQDERSAFTTIMFNSGYGCVVCHQVK